MDLTQSKESARCPSRTRDPRMNDTHSQKPSCNKSSSTHIGSNRHSVTPPPARFVNPSTFIADSHSVISPPTLSISDPSLLEKENDDLLYIARLSVLTKAKKLGCLSGPVLQHSLEKTIGNPTIHSHLSLISVLLDQELGKKSLNLGIELGKLPTFRKKGAKKEHAVVILALFSLYKNIVKAIDLRENTTRIDKWINIKIAFKELNAIMKVVDGEAEQVVDDLSTSTKSLKSLKVNEEEWKRRYMKCRNTKMPPKGYGCCVFCNHDFIDVPPVNVDNAEKNKLAMAKYSEQYKHLQDYKDKKRFDPPLNSKGKEVKKVTPPTMLKTILRCHCHQQRRAMPSSNAQSTCPILCVNQTTQLPYRAGECPLCQCPCSKSYYLEEVPKIKSELLLEKETKNNVQVASSKQQANEWIARCNNTGRLVQETGKAALLGKTPLAAHPSESTEQYLNEIYDVAKAKDMVLNLPSSSASSYLKKNIVNPMLIDPARRSVIVLDGEEVDLRTTSGNRSRNNGLTTMEAPVSIDLFSSSSSSSIQIESKRKSNEDSDSKIKRMKKRAGKFMHGTKRPSAMSAEEKGERAAAIKVSKLYSKILAEDKSEEEVEAIKNALDDDEAFGSQTYNECFMNIFGFAEE